MLCARFANATQVWLYKSDHYMLENVIYRLIMDI